MNRNKRLCKSDDPVIAGVCGGFADYFELDPTLVRILTVVFVLVSFGLPLVVYIIAMVVMPKRSDDYPKYIDVKPPAESSSTTRDASSPVTGAPGCAYTASNPQAYDAAIPADQTTADPQAARRIRAGVLFGVLLVGAGLFALLGTFFDISIWRFWPLLIIISGFMTLCTPSKNGWSLVRAGHAICLITLGFAVQLWTLDIVTTATFVLTFMYLWPVLLVVLGLFVIGSATDQSIFNLIGSLILSIALLFGVWNFGQVFILLPPLSPPDSQPVSWGAFWPFG
jgi:phage shock protein PspC (stress-responsive transcriptional regulator)